MQFACVRRRLGRSFLPLFHGGNRGSNPLGDANCINYLREFGEAPECASGATILGGSFNHLSFFTLCPFSGIKRECKMNARHCCLPTPAPALLAAAITAGWLAKFVTSPARPCCRWRRASCSGWQRITAAAAISWTGEPVRPKSGPQPLPADPARLHEPLSPISQ